MKKIFLFTVCVIVSLLFFGCHKDTINFYRESKVSEMMEELKLQHNDDTIVKKNSGIIIYKDQTSTNQTSRSSANFGPAEIKFYKPIEFKN